MVVGTLLSPNIIPINTNNSTPKQAPCSPDEQVVLNVGGEHHVVHTSDMRRYPNTMFARMVDQIWRKDLGPKTIFIDRSPKYFKLILEFIVHGTVHLPRSDIELAEIIQEAELDELISLVIREDRRCFGEGPPFFPKDRVVWKTCNFWRQMIARGWSFDGNKAQLPLCFTHFT
ncbi:K+ channel tetramerization domain protein, partial [Cooperia oncophora]